jgi:Fur family transcriptional regulator, ferric uptake regulator
MGVPAGRGLSGEILPSAAVFVDSLPDLTLVCPAVKNSSAGREEKEVFAAYITRNRLKRSEQREIILDTFLRAERHLSVDDLLQLVQRRRPDIGRTTVYRTLKLLHMAGLAQELVLQGQTYFEREYKRQHHDHFICNTCGEIFEFSNPEIERLQEEAASELGFVIEGHRHQVFGRCRRCAARPAAEARK